MLKRKVEINLNDYPSELHYFFKNTEIFDSSCSKEARVIYLKDHHLFLKSAQKNTLKNEAMMNDYFYKKNLSSKVLKYISDERDFLLTEEVLGEDCTHYIDQPEKLCDKFAEILYKLHHTDFSDCPIQNRTKDYLATAHFNFKNGIYDTNLFPDNWGYSSPKEAYNVILSNQSD